MSLGANKQLKSLLEQYQCSFLQQTTIMEHQRDNQKKKEKRP